VLDNKKRKLLKNLESFLIHNEGHRYSFAISQYIESHRSNCVGLGTGELIKRMIIFTPDALEFLRHVINTFSS